MWLLFPKMCNHKRKWMPDLSFSLSLCVCVRVPLSPLLFGWHSFKMFPSSHYESGTNRLCQSVRGQQTSPVCVYVRVVAHIQYWSELWGTQPNRTTPINVEQRNETEERKISVGPTDLGRLLEAFRQSDEGTNRHAERRTNSLFGWMGEARGREGVSPLSP